jgi:RAB6A-GEF complex partner protein 2
VQWTEQTVFAGEEIECQITFKNIATVPAPSKTSLHPSAANGLTSGGGRQRKTPTAQIKTNSTLSPRPSPPNRGHRTALSLSTPAGHTQPQSTAGSWNGQPPKATKDGGTHRRSVSIISIGASEGGFDDLKSHGSLPERPRGMSRGHGRSASLQIVPRRYGVNGGPTFGRRDSYLITEYC